MCYPERRCGISFILLGGGNDMMELAVVREIAGDRREEMGRRRRERRRSAERAATPGLRARDAKQDRRAMERRASRWQRRVQALAIFGLFSGGLGLGIYTVLDRIGFFEFI